MADIASNRHGGATSLDALSRRRFLGAAAAVTTAAAAPASLGATLPEPSAFARAVSAMEPVRAAYEGAVAACSAACEAVAPLDPEHFRDEAEGLAEAVRGRVGAAMIAGDEECRRLHKRLAELDAEDARNKRSSNTYKRLVEEEVGRDPEVVAARAAQVDRVRAYEVARMELHLDALEEAEDAACDALHKAMGAIEIATPVSLSEFLHKMDILAVYRDGAAFSYADALDLVARDLWPLGGRYVLSDESAGVYRMRRPFDDSPPFNADRSRAHWCIVDGRPVVEV